MTERRSKRAARAISLLLTLLLVCGALPLTAADADYKAGLALRAVSASENEIKAALQVKGVGIGGVASILFGYDTAVLSLNDDSLELAEGWEAVEYDGETVPVLQQLGTADGWAYVCMTAATSGSSVNYSSLTGVVTVTLTVTDADELSADSIRIADVPLEIAQTDEGSALYANHAAVLTFGYDVIFCDDCGGTDDHEVFVPEMKYFVESRLNTAADDNGLKIKEVAATSGSAAEVQVSGIKTEQKASVVVGQFSAALDVPSVSAPTAELTVQVVDAEDEVLAQTVNVGTGCKVQLVDEAGTVVEEMVVVVKGDISGDGKVSVKDALSALNAYTGGLKLTGCYSSASDIDNNGKTSVKDALSILLAYTSGTDLND